MEILHQTVLLLMCTFVLCQHRRPTGADAAYEEIVELNATCYPPIACSEKQRSDLFHICECGSSCIQHGTCCVDSPNRWIPSPKVTAKCRPVLNQGLSLDGLWLFMVDRCPQQKNGSKSIYDDLCTEEWNGQNDVMRLVPVTSLFTHLTYKNYFCLRCHETGDDHVFWKAEVDFYGEANKTEDCGDIQLEYDSTHLSWHAQAGPGCGLLPVFKGLKPPSFVAHLIQQCDASLISNCSENWQDESVRSKCDAYMYTITVIRDGLIRKYRNPHCALCNYESLDDKDCYTGGKDSCDNCGSVSSGGFFVNGVKQPFSFTYLIDVNPADGNRVGKRQRCTVNSVWDPFFNKCRFLKCALPGYTVRDGKCIPP